VALRSGVSLQQRLTMLEHYEQVAAARRLPRLQQLVSGWRLQTLLDSGASVSADLMVVDTGLEAETEHVVSEERHWRQQVAMGMALSNWYQERGQGAKAQALLGRLEKNCASGQRARQLAQVRALRALVRQQRGELHLALAALGAALDYAMLEHAWHVVVSAGRPMRTLLHLAQQDGAFMGVDPRRRGAVHHLLQLIGADQAQDAGDDMTLNAREAEVLRELCRGLSNKEIGRLMNLSENTVKFHLKRVYRKLGVDSRGEAVAVAIKQGLDA